MKEINKLSSKVEESNGIFLFYLQILKLEYSESKNQFQKDLAEAKEVIESLSLSISFDVWNSLMDIDTELKDCQYLYQSTWHPVFAYLCILLILSI
mmetsp:Transcript_5253/g.4438  ORF Transcript_5253/g.4438 Transcript_5253/m.4438 type:complete len:96 (+) Transcript_5253:780-1067(+)